MRRKFFLLPKTSIWGRQWPLSSIFVPFCLSYVQYLADCQFKTEIWNFHTCRTFGGLTEKGNSPKIWKWPLEIYKGKHGILCQLVRYWIFSKVWPFPAGWVSNVDPCNLAHLKTHLRSIDSLNCVYTALLVAKIWQDELDKVCETCEHHPQISQNSVNRFSSFSNTLK